MPHPLFPNFRFVLMIYSGTAHHTVKVFNFGGSQLSSFEPYSGFLHGNRSAPIAATAFHPHHMVLAAASRADNHVNLFTCEEKKGTAGDGPP
jgi:regulator-associated protein of mTOR